MIKEIRYSGHSASPSDYECPDGEMSALNNLIPESGGLQPILPPKTIFSLSQGQTVIFIHRNTNYTNYIVRIIDGLTNNISLSVHGSSKESFLTIIPPERLVDISSLGNILIVSSDKHLYYFIFKNGKYSFLGNQVPDVDIAFHLEGSVYAHTYVDSGLTVGTNNAANEKDLWSTILNYSYIFRGSWGEYDYSDYTYLDDNLVIEEGRSYAFSTEYDGDSPFYYLYIEGKTSDNNYKVITGFSPRKIVHHIVVRSGEKFTNIRIRIQSRVHFPHGYVNNALIIEAFDSNSTSVNNPIAYNRENYSTVMSIANHFVNKYATEKERFIYPFFIRYAIKLYDGSYINPSSPILMVPNSGYTPFLSYNYDKKVNVVAYAFIADLKYELLNAISENWRELITGIDIFVSNPIYPYLQGKDYNSVESLFDYYILDNDKGINEIKGLSYGNLSVIQNGKNVTEGTEHIDLYSVLKEFFSFGDKNINNQWKVLQIAKAKDVMEKIANTSQFFHIHSLEFNELITSSGMKNIYLKDGILSSLVNRQTLNVDILQNRSISSAKMFRYNNRTHAYDVSFSLPSPKSILLNNQFIFFNKNNINSIPSELAFAEMYVFIHTPYGERVVKKELLNDYSSVVYGQSWFFYPDNNAYKVLFVCRNSRFTCELSLKRHSILNGAYWLADSMHEKLDSYISYHRGLEEPSYSPPDVNNTITSTNTIYVSEANNPFSYRSQFAVSVGCDLVYALSSAAKPLSEGQFGQYPLYAFTDEGVWALELTGTGTYFARQPITRDVCKNRDGITQLDSAVLFSTDRGLMLISGSESICISEILDSKSVFSMSQLQGSNQLLKLAGMGNENVSYVPFKEFLTKGRMLYDYTNQRIIVFSPEHSYAYIYSLESKKWGMMQSNLASGVNAYPEAMAMTKDNMLVDFSHPDESVSVKGLLVSRPLKLDDGDILKTIDTIIQRGQFRKGHVSSVLYGSRDLYNWSLVWSSKDHYLRGFRGTPYKFFRIALVCNLEKDESITGCTVQFTPSLINQPR